jgi:hypothetical protein
VCRGGERIEGVIGIPGEHLCQECTRGHGTLQAAWVSWAMFRAGSPTFAADFGPLLWRRLQEIAHGLRERLVALLCGLSFPGQRKDSDVQIGVAL